MKIIILLLLLLIIPTVTLANDLIIVEIKVSGESPDESHITIFNQAEKDLDISGFRLRKKSSTGRESSLRVFPPESIISANNYFTWANSKNNYHLDIKANVWSTAGIANNNSVALFSTAGDIIDSVTWGEGENQFIMGSPLRNPEKNQIIKRLSSALGYQTTNDNSQDFHLYPEIKPDITQGNLLHIETKRERDNALPVATGAIVAISSALSILILKKSLC